MEVQDFCPTTTEKGSLYGKRLQVTMGLTSRWSHLWNGMKLPKSEGNIPEVARSRGSSEERSKGYPDRSPRKKVPGKGLFDRVVTKLWSNIVTPEKGHQHRGQ